MRRLTTIFGLSVLVGMALATVGGPAGANSFGGPGSSGNYAANNGTHEVFMSGTLDSDLKTDTNWSLDNNFTPLAWFYAYDVYSATSANDVRVYDGDYGDTGWVATAPCPYGAWIGGSGDGEWCKPRYVKYNRGEYPTYFDTQTERRHYACHEIGHTVGLFHYAGDCMNGLGSVTVLHSHNKSHIEGHY